MNDPNKKEKGTTKTCPACGTAFVCNAANISQCECSTIKLTPEQAELISSKYKDCLCGKCLKEISKRKVFPQIEED